MKILIAVSLLTLVLMMMTVFGLWKYLLYIAVIAVIILLIGKVLSTFQSEKAEKEMMDDINSRAGTIEENSPASDNSELSSADQLAEERAAKRRMQQAVDAYIERKKNGEE